MRMQKGLCIELNEEYSVFIGPSGGFVHGTPARDSAVGEESYFYPKQDVGAKRRKAIKPIWAPIAAAVAVTILFLSVLLPRHEAFAYVQIQVNPGIELGIDENYEVVSMRELNEDGLELIGELGEWKHYSLDEVLDKVIDLSMKDGTDEIVITTVADDEDEIADEAVVNSVMAISAKVMAGNVAVRLKEASKKQWRASVEKSVPVGQLISDSKSLKNDQSEKKTTDKSDDKPVNVKEKQTNVDKPTKKESESGEKQPKTPANKEKATPAGQEKRQETPAAEKGKLIPSGQDKRNELPGQNKNNASPESNKPKAEKEKDKDEDATPGQQKMKDEDTGDKEKAKRNENSSIAKDNKEKPKPGIAGPQNVKGKNALQENNSADNDKGSDKSKNKDGKINEN